MLQTMYRYVQREEHTDIPFRYTSRKKHFVHFNMLMKVKKVKLLCDLMKTQLLFNRYTIQDFWKT